MAVSEREGVKKKIRFLLPSLPFVARFILSCKSQKGPRNPHKTAVERSPNACASWESQPEQHIAGMPLAKQNPDVVTGVLCAKQVTCAVISYA